FFGASPEQMARGAYAAYHDVARWVPPPVAINYQLLAFRGRPPEHSALEMAYDFSRHFDPEIAPELVSWWETMLAEGKIPRLEERETRAALSEAKRRLASLAPPEIDAPRTPPDDLRTRLSAAVDDWLGTPYRFGGVDRSGIDCSAFVRILMRRTLGLELPRNSRAQARVGTAVPRTQLRAGDLVFFDTLERGRVTHVGVYLGEGRFAHASSSRGVVRSALATRYYRRAYRSARRMTR
ncbi:MAG: NlpC/P60 family protein, partial [Myxococcota bacterium]